MQWTEHVSFVNISNYPNALWIRDWIRFCQNALCQLCYQGCPNPPSPIWSDKEKKNILLWMQRFCFYGQVSLSLQSQKVFFFKLKTACVRSCQLVNISQSINHIIIYTLKKNMKKVNVGVIRCTFYFTDSNQTKFSNIILSVEELIGLNVTQHLVLKFVTH